MGLSVENLCEEKYDIFENLVTETFVLPIDKNLCPLNYKRFAHF